MHIIIGDNYYSGIRDDLIIDQTQKNVFERLEQFLYKHKNDYKILLISYELKDKIEELESNNNDNVQLPILRCIIPEKVLPKIDFKPKIKSKNEFIKFEPEFNKQNYISIVNKIKDHIQKGDIYETNFCYNWESKQIINDTYSIFKKLNTLTKAPFSVYAEIDDHVIISASPERFLKKEGNKLITQPIKGTAKRGINKKEDIELINQLKNDHKENTENIMIVDLVRNDLSKIATENSVNVDELCKVYTFENIHQMISTVSCYIDNKITISDIIKSLFPMGSMTGVPKIRAMKLMEKYESSKRGLYSGSIGVIQPNGDFDFNVVIRTMIYNKANDYVSFKVGSAITINSDPEKEYEETLIKAEALLKACN